MPKLILYLLVISSTTSLLHAEAPAPKGKDLAVFFAVSQYQSSALGDLPQTLDNSRQMAELLATYYGFDTLVVQNPTLDRIDQFIHQLKQQYQSGKLASDGQLLLFFLGHGEKNYFLPADAKIHQLHRSGLYYDEWRPIISAIPCQHILVAIDACYSVTFDPHWATMGGRPRFQRPGQLTEEEYLLLNHRRYKARLFITSDAKEDVVPGQSTFARKIIEGLRQLKQHKDFFSIHYLFSSYIKKARPTPNFGAFEGDEPDSDFFFFPVQGRESKVEENYIQNEKDMVAYQNILGKPSIANCSAYLQRFPFGIFRKEVKLRLETLKEIQDWNIACLKNTPTAYQQYLLIHPTGAHAAEARSKTQNRKKEETAPSVQLLDGNMIFVQGGHFRMRESTERGMEGKHVHLKGFYISKYEVSMGEFLAYASWSAKGHSRRDLSLPITNIDWYEAISYCNWRSEQEGLTPVYSIQKNTPSPFNNNNYDRKKWTVEVNWQANGYRLPTEAEWEYAARGQGKANKWAGTSNPDLLPQYANGKGAKDGFSALAPIDSLSPNEMGLHHMSGNAWEWCWDWYGSYALSSKYNPVGPTDGKYRILRGGSCKDDSTYLSTSYRGHSDPDYANQLGGIRLVRSKL